LDVLVAANFCCDDLSIWWFFGSFLDAEAGSNDAFLLQEKVKLNDLILSY